MARQVIWSLAKLEHYPPQLFTAAMEVTRQRGADFDGKSLANILWALAHMGHREGTEAMLCAVMPSIAQRATVSSHRRMPVCQSQQAATRVWKRPQ
jgi:hypothetical protein